MSSVGKRLRQRRESHGWSQSELARRMVDAGWSNYRQMTVSRTEDEARTPRLDEAVALAKVLQVPFTWLVDGDENTDLYSKGFSDGVAHVFRQIENLKEQAA